MKSWFGPILINEITNEGTREKDENPDGDFLPLQNSNLKFVHYPDCQQLIIWLPNPGRDYDKVQMVKKKTGALVEEWPVSDRLGGSIQVLWDTLPVKPGAYTIRIIKDMQHLHEITITKYKEGEELSEPEQDKPEAASTGPIVYRDSTGKIIEDEDLRLREKVMKEITDRFNRHIEYQGAGRGGYVIYVEGDLRLSFYYESGAGKCIAYIEIPAEDKWEKETNTSLSRRQEIITFTAHQVQAKQAPRSLLKISADAIEFWER